MTAPWVRVQDDGVELDVLVLPGAHRNRIVGLHDGRLKIQVTAPPEDGAANRALQRFLAETLDIAKAQVEIVSGASNRRKRVRIASVTLALVQFRLTE